MSALKLTKEILKSGASSSRLAESEKESVLELTYQTSCDGTNLFVKFSGENLRDPLSSYFVVF
jgi:hypothetical protein